MNTQPASDPHLDDRPDARLREVRRELCAAEDEKITRVVRMVDQMADRGAADALIAPLRSRLAELRVTRPVVFTRLLFMPLDALIVPAGAWQRSGFTVPRTCLAPLSAQLRETMPELAQELDRQLVGKLVDDRPALEALGTGLWAQAAAQLRNLAPPPLWEPETGLSVADHAELCRVIAAVLAQARSVACLVASAASGATPDADEIRGMMASAAADGPKALTMQLTLLMARLPNVARLVGQVRDMALPINAGELRRLTDAALDFLLDGIDQAALLAGPLDVTAARLTPVAGLLAEFHDRSGHAPARMARAREARQKMDLACQERFQSVLRTQGLYAGGTCPLPNAPAWDGLEQSLRDIRRFEHTARQIGGAPFYDAVLTSAAEALRLPSSALAPQVMRHLRAVEILCGPERALAMIGGPEMLDDRMRPQEGPNHGSASR